MSGWKSTSDIMSCSYIRERDNLVIELIHDCGEDDWAEYDVCLSSEDGEEDGEISRNKNFEDSLEEAEIYMRENP